ncbi:Type II inositol 1,4,5-trisphosphate 5-phosphatase [Balamuthia mandrillaris]
MKRILLARQKALEKLGKSEVTEDPEALRNQLLRNHENKHGMSDVVKRLEKYHRDSETIVEDSRGVSSALLEYAQVLNAGYGKTSLGTVVERLVELQSSVQGIQNSLNQEMKETIVCMETLLRSEVHEAMGWKAKHERARLRYDAAQAKHKSATERARKTGAQKGVAEAEKELFDCRKEYELLGKETLCALLVINEKVEWTLLQRLCDLMEAYDSFFSKGSSFTAALKQQFSSWREAVSQGKQEWEDLKTKQENVIARAIDLSDLSELASYKKTQKHFFGVPLNDLWQRDGGVPPLIKAAIDHLHNVNAIKTEGVFRISGNIRTLEWLKARADSGEHVDFNTVDDVNCVTGFIKRWLRELPEPIMTFALYNSFLELGRRPQLESSIFIQETKRLISQLPHCNYAILELVLKLCMDTLAHSQQNKMTAAALATVLGPNLLFIENPNPMTMMEDMQAANVVVERMICYYLEIFEGRPSEPTSCLDRHQFDVISSRAEQTKAASIAAELMEQFNAKKMGYPAKAKQPGEHSTEAKRKTVGVAWGTNQVITFPSLATSSEQQPRGFAQPGRIGEGDNRDKRQSAPPGIFQQVEPSPSPRSIVVKEASSAASSSTSSVTTTGPATLASTPPPTTTVWKVYVPQEKENRERVQATDISSTSPKPAAASATPPTSLLPRLQQEGLPPNDDPVATEAVGTLPNSSSLSQQPGGTYSFLLSPTISTKNLLSRCLKEEEARDAASKAGDKGQGHIVRTLATALMEFTVAVKNAQDASSSATLSSVQVERLSSSLKGVAFGIKQLFGELKQGLEIYPEAKAKTLAHSQMLQRNAKTLILAAKQLGSTDASSLPTEGPPIITSIAGATFALVYALSGLFAILDYNSLPSMDDLIPLIQTCTQHIAKILHIALGASDEKLDEQARFALISIEHLSQVVSIKAAEIVNPDVQNKLLDSCEQVHKRLNQLLQNARTHMSHRERRSAQTQGISDTATTTTEAQLRDMLRGIAAELLQLTNLLSSDHTMVTLTPENEDKLMRTACLQVEEVVADLFEDSSMTQFEQLMVEQLKGLLESMQEVQHLLSKQDSPASQHHNLHTHIQRMLQLLTHITAIKNAVIQHCPDPELVSQIQLHSKAAHHYLHIMCLDVSALLLRQEPTTATSTDFPLPPLAQAAWGLSNALSPLFTDFFVASCMSSAYSSSPAYMLSLIDGSVEG